MLLEELLEEFSYYTTFPHFCAYLEINFYCFTGSSFYSIKRDFNSVSTCSYHFERMVEEKVIV